VEEALNHHRRPRLGPDSHGGKIEVDSLWLGVKKADQLITICHCCDCCCYFKLYRSCPGGRPGLQKWEGLEVRWRIPVTGVEFAWSGALSRP